MDYYKEALKVHKDHRGKLNVVSSVGVNTPQELAVAYTPGVAQPCLEIAKNTEKVYDYTIKSHTIAVVTDGSAVLGLGNIGPEAALPVMEGKCALFKEFANVDAFPIAVDSQSVEEIVKTTQLIAPVFGGINLEDIAAPRCFEVEKQLNELLDIPVFHDDQHGTAIVVCAAVINAYRLLNKSLEQVKAVVNGAGAAGVSIARLLLKIGVKDVVICDSKGAIHSTRPGLDDSKCEITKELKEARGYGFDADVKTLSDAVRGRDLFIGVSAADALKVEDVKAMNPEPVIFAMANPVPEIMPDLAIEAGAAVVGTGRSDFANQINNVLAFPGIFKGALDARAPKITDQMKLASVYALADFIPTQDLTPQKVIPSAFDAGVAQAVAKAVKEAANQL
ncbi:malate dehydrogenase [Actinomycetota bacterium]|nr:malate dehydrogenase [Actinomycetota bacterium]